MCGLDLHTVACFQHGQLETLTAKTQHGIALALTVEFVFGGSIVRLLVVFVNIVCFAMLFLSDTHEAWSTAKNTNNVRVKFFASCHVRQ